MQRGTNDSAGSPRPPKRARTTDGHRARASLGPRRLSRLDDAASSTVVGLSETIVNATSAAMAASRAVRKLKGVIPGPLSPEERVEVSRVVAVSLAASYRTRPARPLGFEPPRRGLNPVGSKLGGVDLSMIEAVNAATIRTLQLRVAAKGLTRSGAARLRNGVVGLLAIKARVDPIRAQRLALEIPLAL